jgi:hypothetical protein
MADRTTKVLLAVVAAGLWGLLLRPAFTPSPVQAQRPPSAPPMAIAAMSPVYGDHGNFRGAVFVATGGEVYQFDLNNKQPVMVSKYGKDFGPNIPLDSSAGK